MVTSLLLASAALLVSCGGRTPLDSSGEWDPARRSGSGAPPPEPQETRPVGVNLPAADRPMAVSPADAPAPLPQVPLAPAAAPMPQPLGTPPSASVAVDGSPFLPEPTPPGEFEDCTAATSDSADRCRYEVRCGDAWWVTECTTDEQGVGNCNCSASTGSERAFNIDQPPSSESCKQTTLLCTSSHFPELQHSCRTVGETVQQDTGCYTSLQCTQSYAVTDQLVASESWIDSMSCEVDASGLVRCVCPSAVGTSYVDFNFDGTGQCHPNPELCAASEDPNRGSLERECAREQVAESAGSCQTTVNCGLRVDGTDAGYALIDVSSTSVSCALNPDRTRTSCDCSTAPDSGWGFYIPTVDGSLSCEGPKRLCLSQPDQVHANGELTCTVVDSTLTGERANSTAYCFQSVQVGDTTLSVGADLSVACDPHDVSWTCHCIGSAMNEAFLVTSEAGSLNSDPSFLDAAIEACRANAVLTGFGPQGNAIISWPSFQVTNPGPLSL
jgi:hypothetical protein